jgi:hypothetical protein
MPGRSRIGPDFDGRVEGGGEQERRRRGRREGHRGDDILMRCINSGGELESVPVAVSGLSIER